MRGPVQTLSHPAGTDFSNAFDKVRAATASQPCCFASLEVYFFSAPARCVGYIYAYYNLFNSLMHAYFEHDVTIVYY